MSYAKEAVVGYESVLLSLREYAQNKGVRAAYMTRHTSTNTRNCFTNTISSTRMLNLKLPNWIWKKR